MTKTVKHGDLGPGDTIWYRNARATIISIIEGADRMLEVILWDWALGRLTRTWLWVERMTVIFNDS